MCFTFKSVKPEVKKADDIDDYVGEALSYQYQFEKRTSPWEAAQWDYDKLQAFKIDTNKVDRLYHIYNFDDGVGDRDFELIVRLEHEGRPLYVELSAGCDYTGFDCQGSGIIFVSRDANLFMKLVLKQVRNKDVIYESLRADGIQVDEEYYEYSNNCSRMLINSAPMLKYLCHQAIYDEISRSGALQGYQTVLPKILAESVTDFIRTEEAKRHYDACWTLDY